MHTRCPDDLSAEVLVTVSNPLARGRAEAACRAIGAIPKATSIELLKARTSTMATTVVFDAVPFARAADVIGTLHSRNPYSSVVLFPPAMPGVADLLLAAGRMACVAACIQWSDARDIERLASTLLVEIGSRPEAIVQRVVSLLLPGNPACVYALMRCALRRRAAGKECTLFKLTSDMGMSQKQLRSWWPAEMPTPSQFVKWVTLLYAARLREDTGTSWDSLARSMGIAENTLRRLRHRAEVRADVFVEVVLRFAARCRVPEPVAMRRLEAISQLG